MYQSLADELSRFEIAAVTRVYGFVGLASKRIDSRASNNTKLSFYPTKMTRPQPIQRPPKASQVAADFQAEVLGTSSATRETQVRATQSMQPASRLGDLDGRDDDGSIGSVVHEAPLQRQSRSTIPDVDSDGQPRVRRLGQWPVSKGQVARTNVSTRRSANPQYKNPFHGQKPSGPVVQALQTPRLVRPRTAPAGSAGTMLIPRTERAAHKRSASESFLETSFTSASRVSDSQPSLMIAASQDFDFQQQPERQRAATEPPDTTAVINPTFLSQTHKRRRLTVAESDEVAMEDIVEAEPKSASPVKSSFERKYLVRRPPGYEGPYFLRDRSEDWTSPPEPSASDSSSNAVSSTLSPSQPLALRWSQTRLSPTSAQPPASIDLISDTPPETPRGGEQTAANQTSSPTLPRIGSSPRLPSDPSESPISATRSFYNGSHVTQPPQMHSDRSAGSPSTTSNRTYDFTSSIRSLPDRIQAPAPPVGSGPFTTHVSKDLSTMVGRLPLSKHFRPVEVTRDVHVLERGHWSLRVKVASDKDVAEARRPYSQGEILAALNKQMSGVTPTERDRRYAASKAAGHEVSVLGLSKRCDLWTVDEFLCFWEVLTKYVEDGKAGHGLSVAKDWASEAVTPGRSTQSTYARIRVYTWGEVVGHIWIALWVLSDKKTAYAPMEWISSNDSVIVKMSGDRRNGGKLGPWVPKGTPGGKGSWGIDAGTPPGNQGKYVRFPSS